MNKALGSSRVRVVNEVVHNQRRSHSAQKSPPVVTPRTLDVVLSRLATISSSVRWFGDPILRTVATPITARDRSTGVAGDIVDRLTSTLGTIRNAIGIGRAIAAPQIGISKRVVVVIGGLDDPQEAAAFINPCIVWHSSECCVFSEMCLSGLPLAADVVRPEMVEVAFEDLSGRTRSLRPTPLVARVLQHELDHLDGVLFLDRADVQTIRFVGDLEEYKLSTKLRHLSGQY